MGDVHNFDKILGGSVFIFLSESHTWDTDIFLLKTDGEVINRTPLRELSSLTGLGSYAFIENSKEKMMIPY